VERALAALAPKGFHVAHDGEVMRQLIDIAPPGADELFAIIRLHDLLLDDERPDFVVIDTAPTGHFLRFLELPRTATEWVREFMRILLRYSELIPTGRLGSDLVRSSRALAAFDALLRSRETAAIVVTRPEKLVLAETSRLLERLGALPMEVAGVVANYLAPLNECPCDAVRREAEENALVEFSRAGGATLWRVEEQDEPVTDRDRLRALVPIVLTSE
jgi:arsenite-transporting ATPase